MYVFVRLSVMHDCHIFFGESEMGCPSKTAYSILKGFFIAEFSWLFVVILVVTERNMFAGNIRYVQSQESIGF